MKSRAKKTIVAVIILAAVAVGGAAFGVIYGMSGTQNSSYPETADAVLNEENETLSHGNDTEDTVITLAQDASKVSGSGASVSGNTVTVIQGGTYRLSGTLTEGQIYVDADDEDEVILILDGVDITNSSDAAIYIKNADETCVYLADDSVNRLQSGISMPDKTTDEGDEDDEDDEDNDAKGAALYSKDDLSVTGEGTLYVYGYVNNGIHTSDDLEIDSGTIVVEAANNGIKGKKSVTINGGDLTVTSAGDGIEAGSYLTIMGGDFEIVTGSGSADVTFSSSSGWGMRGYGWDMSSEDVASMKGIKCDGDIEIYGGEIIVDSYDDAIHSNKSVTIAGGNLILSTGDDGIHGEDSLLVSDGVIEISKSYEGLEANQILIQNGEINITASDDGINANGGSSRFGFGGMGGFPGGSSSEGSDDTDSESPNLIISGGKILIDADGDGLDSNGNLIVEGGEIIVNGPTSSANGAIDAGTENGGVCTISGGTLIALGSSMMAETFSSDSGQCSFKYTGSFSEDTPVIIADEDGNILFEYNSVKSGSSIVFSSEALTQGGNYIISVGDDSVEFTQSQISTSVSGSGGTGGWSGAGINPGDILSGDIDPNDILSGDIDLNDILSGDIDLSDILPDDIDPNDIFSGDMDPGDMDPGDMNPGNMIPGGGMNPGGDMNPGGGRREN